MQGTALERFQDEFRRWVAAHNEKHLFHSDADELLRALQDRIPPDRLTHIGSALLNGWLETDPRPGRGYFVREDGREAQSSHPTLVGGKKVTPWWELFVQLADYGWLRAIAGRHGHVVRLEDRYMDITVHAGDTLLLYVENKVDDRETEKLLAGIRAWGERGVTDKDRDRNDDGLKKAHYMLHPDARPQFFGLSALGYHRSFRVEYPDDTHLRLVDDERSFSAILADHLGDGTAPKRAVVDALAAELQRPDSAIWASCGTGQTAYNFYAPGPDGDAIIVGVFKDGQVWTNVRELGPDRAAHLARNLDEIGIELNDDKAWPHWRFGGKTLNLADADPVAIAGAVRHAIGEAR